MRPVFVLCLCLTAAVLIGCQEQTTPTTGDDTVKNDISGPLTILDIGTRDYRDRLAVSVLFSNPLDGTQPLNTLIQLDAVDAPTPEGGWVLDEAGTGAFFTNVAPKTRYRVTVRSGLSGVDGQRLALTQTKEVETRQLIDAVTFDFQGSVMPQSGPIGLPVVTTNVAEVRIDFHRIKPARVPEFIRMVRHNRYYRYQLQNIARIGELAYTGRFDLDAQENTRLRRLIPLGEIEPLAQPGLYVAVMERPGTYDYERSVTYFAVSELAMHVRVYQSRTDAWVLDLENGSSRPDVLVQALDGNGEVLEESYTGPDGTVTFNQLSGAAVLLAQSDNSYCLVELRDPALDLSSFDLGSRTQRPMELFLYGPRDLYRPGETVVVSALIRNADGMRTEDATLRATLLRPDGVALRSFNWTAENLGYYERKLPIPSGAPTGRWILRIDAPFTTPVEYRFLVEEFLPERMRLELAQNQDSVAPGNAISIQLLGEYLYGAPAAGNRANAIVNVARLREPLTDYPGFQFGVIEDNNLEQQFEVADLNLDSDGIGQIVVDSNWHQTSSPLTVTTAVTLYESGGRPVTRTTDTPIWPDGPQIGIRPSFDKAGPPADSVVAFEFVNVNFAGERAASEGKARLIREDRQYYWEFTESEGWHYEYTSAEYPVAEYAISLGTDDFPSAQFPVDWGFYRLEVFDDSGMRASLRFHAGQNWYASWRQSQDPNQPARPDEVELTLDKPAYQAGDMVRINLKPPAAGQTLVLIESDRPLWQHQLYLPETGATVEVLMDPSWEGHSLYVSAVTIAETADTAVPRRAFGLVHLPLDREDRRVEVDLTTPEKIEPQSTLELMLQLKPGSQLIEGSLMATVAAVDSGVLSLTEFRTPDPHAAFFGQRRYQPEIRDMYSDLIDTSGRSSGTLRFGGDTSGAKGGKPPPADRDIVALFSGPVEFGPDGRATVALDVPDFNGELRVMVVTFSDSAFGHAEARVKVAAPLILEFSGPRFLAHGDESHVVVDVTNLTDEAQSLQAQISAAGAVSGERLLRSLALSPGQREKIQFNVHASRPWGTGEVTIQIEGASLDQFTRSWQVGTRPAYPASRRVLQTVLDPGGTVTVPADWGHGLIPSTAQARLHVSASPNLDLPQYASALAQYPYGCLEQTTSKGFAVALATPDNQSKLGLRLQGTDRRNELVQMTLDRLTELQRHNGAFSMWDRTRTESPWLTTYAAALLVELRDQGFLLPPKMLQKTLNRLQDYVAGRGPLQDRYSARPAHYRFAVQAQAGLLLAQLRRARLDQLRTLFDTQARDARSRLPLVQLGLALLLQGDMKRGNQALDQALGMTPTQAYLGDYGSEVRDLAASIELLLRLQQRESDALALTFPLREALQRRGWLSTQEQTALLAAGLRLTAHQQLSWKGELTAQGHTSDLAHTGAWTKSFDQAVLDQEIKLVSRHSKALFITQGVSGYPETAPEPSNDGMTLERRYYNLKGEPLNVDAVRTGEVLLVHILVAAEERTPDALVVDLLPAGFELEVQSLAHTLQLDQFSIDGKSMAELIRGSRIKHQEYREDRFVAALELQRGRTAHLVYLARAVTPGRYHLPPTYAEDMYAPDKRAIGHTQEWLRILP